MHYITFPNASVPTAPPHQYTLLETYNLDIFDVYPEIYPDYILTRARYPYYILLYPVTALTSLFREIHSEYILSYIDGSLVVSRRFLGSILNAEAAFSLGIPIYSDIS